MVFLTKKVCLGWGLGGLVVSLFALGQNGCSDDSATPSGGDASADVQADVLVEAGPPPPLGVPVTSCTGCPVCGGVLGSATTGITYCTQNCATNTDCPTGTACVVNTTSPGLSNECIKTCVSASDCTAPFICRADLGTPGSYCWTPYPPVGSPPDGDAAVVDSAIPETGTPDGAPTDSGASDAAPSDASDAAAE